MEMLRGDWYSEKSWSGKGQGWKCRKCGVWVAADRPLICTCATVEDSPDVAHLREQMRLQRELINVKDRCAKMEELLNDVGERYMMQLDGKFDGDLSTRMNMMLGRI